MGLPVQGRIPKSGLLSPAQIFYWLMCLYPNPAACSQDFLISKKIYLTRVFFCFRNFSKADAVAERLRKKAELQKKSAKPLNFTDNLAQEKEKQRQMQKSKEERRIALCEELGRGC